MYFAIRSSSLPKSSLVVLCTGVPPMLYAEMVSQARAISANHRELEVGDVQQLSVTTERVTLMVSTVTPDYYLLLVLGPEGNYGRARFELRRARLLLEKDLI